MKHLPLLAPLLLGAGLCLLFAAQTPRAASLGSTLRENRWKKRVLLVAAPGAEQADFKAQKALLAPAQSQLAARDLLVLDVLYSELTAADTQLLRRLGAKPPHFVVVLIGKDGGVKMSSPRPIAPAALFGTVDQMPMRRAEMRRAAKR